MTYLAGGHEIGFCVPSDATVYEHPGAVAGIGMPYDPATSRCALKIGDVNNRTAFAEWVFATSTTTPNVGFMGLGANPDTSIEMDWIHLLTSANVAQAKVTVQQRDGTGSGDVYLRAYYLAGGATWVQVGTTEMANVGALTKYDVSLNAASSGYLRVYVAKTLRIDSGTVNLSGLSACSKLRIKAVSGANYVSETICATTSTVRLRGYSDYPTADGPDTGWSGSYADVDEAVYSDVDGWQTGSANAVQTVTGSSPSLGGYGVECVMVGARGALGSSGPTKLDIAIRSASDNTNHFSPDIAQAAGYGASVGIWETDPGTATTWSAANASSAKYGVKSVA